MRLRQWQNIANWLVKNQVVAVNSFPENWHRAVYNLAVAEEKFIVAGRIMEKYEVWEQMPECCIGIVSMSYTVLSSYFQVIMSYCVIEKIRIQQQAILMAWFGMQVSVGHRTYPVHE